MIASVRVVSVCVLCLSFVLSGCTSSPAQSAAAEPAPSAPAVSPAPAAQEVKPPAAAQPPAPPAPVPSQPAQESKATAAVSPAPVPSQLAQESKATAAVPPAPAPSQPAQESKAAAASQPPAPSTPDSKAAPSSPDVNEAVVATIGDYTITKAELIQRLSAEVRPQPEDYARLLKPVTAESVLLMMIGEKAMTMEARAIGCLEDPSIHPYIMRDVVQRLDSTFITDYVHKNVPADQNEIAQVLAKYPKATPEQARMLVQRNKMGPVLDALYKQLLEKYHVMVLKENFAKAAQLHERLLKQPVKPRSLPIIQDPQITEELTAEERALPLATYDGGQFTVEDWFRAVCEMAPPGRPKDLGTPEGVGKLVDVKLQVPILALEAKARGYDKDPRYVRWKKEYEDRMALGRMRSQEVENIPEPNAVQIKAFFESHQDWFAEGPTVSVDQIWCRDAATAEKVKSELQSGKDFASVWKQYSLEAKDYVPPTKPAWLLSGEEAAGLGGEKLTVEQPLEKGGFKLTPDKDKKMVMTILGDGRLVYWEGAGLIENVAAKQRFLVPMPKPRDPFEMLTTFRSEGPFFADLSKGEPNQIVGPVKGFYGDGIRWRVVKILAKTPAKIPPYSEQLGANSVRWVITGQQADEILETSMKELREKYGYKLYAERLRGIDPLAVNESAPAAR